jgi:hypothetical protein
MRSSRFFAQTALTLVTLCSIPLAAQNPRNPGVLQKYTATASSRLRFLASDAGKQMLLHSPSPAAVQLLQRFHPDAVGQYQPRQPLTQPAAFAGGHELVSVTGCGTVSGTVMNLEPSANAVSQNQPSVDFLLSALGSGKDLVVETGNDEREELLGSMDSATGIYVHRDGSVGCYGGTDFEMGNAPFSDPLDPGNSLASVGGARVLADDNSAHKQFFFADARLDGTTSGIVLRRVPATNFESTSTCPAGTLTGAQEATCLGSKAILVDGSLDDISDTPVIAQDPRSSGTGAGDVYVVHNSLRRLRSVMLLTACKATFTTTADCSSPLIVTASDQDGATQPGVAVVAGGPNAGAIVITYLFEDSIVYISCTPAGAPARPVCGHHSTVRTDINLTASLSDNPFPVDPWPVIAARTDSGGQTIFVVWSSCKAALVYPLFTCPDADIVMSVATNVTSPSWAFHHVTTSAGHQFMPSIAYDTGQNIVTIAYYSTKSDAYKNQVVMAMNQIASGSITPGATTYVTSSYDSMEGDGTTLEEFFENPLGDFMGLAAHGGSGTGSSRVYLGFTNSARLGTYGSATNTQADNNVSRVTY